MYSLTQTIGQSVLENVVRFKDIVTGASLTAGTKYVFEQIITETMKSRKTSKTAPIKFIYRDTKTKALVQLSSFDLNSFITNGLSIDDYYIMYPEAEVPTYIASEFSIISIKHQLAVDNRTFSDDGTDDNLATPRFRYPLYAYVGYTKYKKTRDDARALLVGDAKDNFRMSPEDIKACRGSGVMEAYKGRHYKQINIDQKLLQVKQEDVDAYLKTL